MANLRDMAEAHLKNVQKQIQDLENTKEQIDNSPSSGGLFSVKPGFTGIADNQFGG